LRSRSVLIANFITSASEQALKKQHLKKRLINFQFTHFKYYAIPLCATSCCGLYKLSFSKYFTGFEKFKIINKFAARFLTGFF
jgi:hypothetical protein